jgi:hypothetical protein
MVRVRFIGLVCLLVWCGAVFAADEDEHEDIEKMLELHRKAGSMEQRLRDYEALQEMRRENGERHLPAGSQFDFSRESFRIRSETAGVQDAKGCAWTSAGPTNLNGRVTSIAIDPTNRDNLYAATVGGIWRSSTRGRRWQRVSDDFLATVFGAIAVNPGNPKEILAGGGDSNFYVWDTGNGMWWSDNYGAPGSWSKVAADFDMQVVYRIRYDPAPPHDVYVAATNGVWLGRHMFGTIQFKKIGGFDAATHDIAVDFSVTPRIIYAGVRENSPTKPNEWYVGIHKWNGTDWHDVSSGIDLSDAETFALAIAESNPSVLYTKVSQRSDDTLVGIYKTTTAGEPTVGSAQSWKPGWVMLPSAVWWEDAEALGAVPDDIMARYNRMLEVDPTDENRVFAGAINMWMSTDGGHFWENVSKGRDPGYKFEAHSDFHTLAFDPLDPNIIYVGNDAGIDRSTDMSQAVWHWQDVAHGMTISQFYTLTSNRLYPTLLAGGMQDNGTDVTYGNRVWYPPGGCDGSDVGADAENPNTIYMTCNGGLSEYVNPIPGTDGGPDPGTYDTGDKVLWNAPAPPIPPLVTDLVTPHAAIAGGGELCGEKTILRTTDGVHWTSIHPNFPPGGTPVALASAPSSGFQTYLAAVAYRIPDAKKCPDFMGMTLQPYVIRTDNGGQNWFPVLGLPADIEPSSLVFDPNNKFRSYVTYAYEKRIYMSTNGVSYLPITGSGKGNVLPSMVRRVVVDPYDQNVLYAATSVGMYRGVITPSSPPTAQWKPFNEGLPDGMNIFDLWVDPETGILTIGTYGFGAYRRDIRPGMLCKSRMLVVRDCVYDDGRELSPCDRPDAEHPIPDLSRPGGFFKPDDTFAGQAWWWTSRDIRVDVPSLNPPANQIADADSVEFEICATSVKNCLAGSMIDSPPQKSKEARVYVQVTNRGVEAVSNARVIALWAPVASAFEALPDTFWTKTFAADGKCGPLDLNTAWRFVDPDEPCRSIPTVAPDYPELARFDWDKVPTEADGGATFLTVVDSAEDPIDQTIRDENKLKPEEIVPGSRHIALRNFHIKPLKFREIHMRLFWPLEIIKLPSDPLDEVELVVSTVDQRDGVHLALPAGLSAHARDGNVRRVRITDEEMVRKLDEMRLDPDNVWEFTGDEASLFIELRAGERVSAAMMAMPSENRSASRVSIVQRSRGNVVGGSVMLLRPEE